MGSISTLLGSSGGGIKSIQRGNFGSSFWQFNVTISSINMAKSFVIITGWSTSGQNVGLTGRLTSSTNLYITDMVNTGANNIYGGDWQVIEFN